MSNGQTLPGQRVVIVDPESLTPRLPGEVGEIWVSGPSVAQGYWNRTEETARTFEAFLRGSGEGPFLRTGDLGFLQDGELFISGRIKDVIIIRGLNYEPHDIELTAQQSHEALQPGGGAAFSVPLGGEERLVILHELKRTHRRENPEEIARAIRHAVAEEQELPVFAVALVKPGGIPRTSSGKVQHYLCRAGYMAGELETIAVSLLDAGQQLLKASTAGPPGPYADDGEVACSLLAYTDRARDDYTNGVDVLGGSGWRVRDNVFARIRAPVGQLAGPAVLFWSLLPVLALIAFVLAAVLMTRGKSAERVVAFVGAAVRWMPGGLALAIHCPEKPAVAHKNGPAGNLRRARKRFGGSGPPQDAPRRRDDGRDKTLPGGVVDDPVPDPRLADDMAFDVERTGLVVAVAGEDVVVDAHVLGQCARFPTPRVAVTQHPRIARLAEQGQYLLQITPGIGILV